MDEQTRRKMEANLELNEKIVQSQCYAVKTAQKLMKRMRSPIFYRSADLTEREKDIAHKLFKLTTTLEYLSWAYDCASNEIIPNVREAIKNNMELICSELCKLFENL